MVKGRGNDSNEKNKRTMAIGNQPSGEKKPNFDGRRFRHIRKANI